MALAVAALYILAATSTIAPVPTRGAAWWPVTVALHTPLLPILCFLAGGLVERLGFYARGRAEAVPGRIPAVFPTVCVQLPMFNEHAVARRVIEAAASIDDLADRPPVLAGARRLDGPGHADPRRTGVRGSAGGIDCRVRSRADRTGYKAGALEAGRRQTDAEFLVIFDADFLPPVDYLLRTIPHFYGADGAPDNRLALVQTQWGHLNADESGLTRAQSLWVDDHHTLQMSWRSAMGGSSTSPARRACGAPRRSKPSAAGARRVSSRTAS
jgi:hypothetical protein